MVKQESIYLESFLEMMALSFPAMGGQLYKLEKTFHFAAVLRFG